MKRFHPLTQRLPKGKKAVFPATALVLATLVCFELAVLLSGGPSRKEHGDFVSYAQSVVEECAGASYKPTCYDEELPKLMDEISMEEAFEVTRIVQDIDTSYRYCHVLGHKLSAKETAKDPDLWQTVIQRCPSGVCSNGCIHGAFQERFRRESLSPEEIEKYKPQFASVCERREGFSPTGLEQASCYHALGHLFMYVTDADIDRSLSLCKELAFKGTRDFSQLCFDGAFMQIFQPLEPDDFALIEGKEVGLDKVEAFCGGYSGRERGSCWSESWPLFRKELFEPNNLIAHCEALPAEPERQRCFNALMYVFTSQMGFDEDKIASYCEGMPREFRGNCFAQAASRIIETDYRNSAASASLCARAAPNDPENLCYLELLKYSTYNFHAGSDAFYAFCGALPDPWKDKCHAKAPR
ncbi:MAG: hypothetical protein HZA81_03485 [Candidatus Taylorbacteria bacterium]|nr:hypothetical protein [Candidatus Taylorbacteria bacterium]